MILLHTCVVSEPLKARPEPKVLNWLDDQAAESLYLSTVSIAELLAGVAALPAGRRRSALSEGLSRVIDRLFANRILAFDQAAAIQLPEIVTTARKSGLPSPSRMRKSQPLPWHTTLPSRRAIQDHSTLREFR